MLILKISHCYKTYFKGISYDFLLEYRNSQGKKKLFHTEFFLAYNQLWEYEKFTKKVYNQENEFDKIAFMAISNKYEELVHETDFKPTITVYFTQ